MSRKNKIACGRYRILGNVMMAAGFLLLCVLLTVLENTVIRVPWIWAGLAGAAVLLIGGFLVKALGWRCPHCKAHLILCQRGPSDRCPCCGVRLPNGRRKGIIKSVRPGGK